MSHDKHYAGRFIAEVVSVDDPEKRCRIKVNVYDIFDGVPVRDLPWAVFSLPLGSRAGEGMLCPVRVGDMVWVEFIGGDTRRPVVVGGAHASPGGQPFRRRYSRGPASLSTSAPLMSLLFRPLRTTRMSFSARTGR